MVYFLTHIDITATFYQKQTQTILQALDYKKLRDTSLSIHHRQLKL